jgi:undecaprenyl-diphosphatase
MAGDLLGAAVLGLVEGITEFLPVSSTGHLIIVGDWLGFTGDRAKTFEIFIQLGAILAIVWIYRARFVELSRKASTDPASGHLLVNLAIAFVPAAAVGFLFHHQIKQFLFSPIIVAVALVAGGVAILVIEALKPRTTTPDLTGTSRRQALGIGLAQVLSLIPGVSRSGSTIMGGYALGLSRAAATEFSFFLSVPVMVAATGFDLLKSRDLVHAADIPLFATGFVVAFVSAVVVVKAFLRYVSHHSFGVFAWYRLAFGAFLFWWYGLRYHA